MFIVYRYDYMIDMIDIYVQLIDIVTGLQGRQTFEFDVL